MAVSSPSPSLYLPARIHRVAWTAPFSWLRRGGNDLRRMPVTSLFVGAIFVLLGYLLTWGVRRTGLGFLWPSLMAAFLFTGPVLAVGFHEISRRLEWGRRTSLDQAAAAWLGNPGQIALMGLVLVFSWMSWLALQIAVFAIFMGQSPPDPGSLAADILAHPQAMPFLAGSLLLAAACGGMVFAVSAVSIPLLMQYEVDAARAILISVSAVLRNPLPMLIWALIILGLTAIGFATLTLGLVVTMPLAGHASWHAYRDLVEAEGLRAAPRY